MDPIKVWKFSIQILHVVILSEKTNRGKLQMHSVVFGSLQIVHES